MGLPLRFINPADMNINNVGTLVGGGVDECRRNPSRCGPPDVSDYGGGFYRAYPHHHPTPDGRPSALTPRFTRSPHGFCFPSRQSAAMEWLKHGRIFHRTSRTSLNFISTLCCKPPTPWETTVFFLSLRPSLFLHRETRMFFFNIVHTTTFDRHLVFKCCSEVTPRFLESHFYRNYHT